MMVIETPAGKRAWDARLQASDCQCFHTARSYGSLVRSPLGFVETPSNPDATVPWCVGVGTDGCVGFEDAIQQRMVNVRD